jgi:hypothetical protein
MQTEAKTEKLDFRQLRVACALEALRQPCRKGKAAPVGELDANAPCSGIVTG